MNLVVAFYNAIEPVAEIAGVVTDLMLPALALGYVGWRVFNAVILGDLLSAESNLGVTAYVPTGKINPKTGNEVYRQELTTFKSKIPFEDIFSRRSSSWVSRKLIQAAQKCTDDNPVVFSFMTNKIFMFGDADSKMQRLISPKWKGGVGEIAQEKLVGAFPSVSDIPYSEKEDMYAVLTYERGARRREFRTLLMTGAQINQDDPAQGGLPALADTEFYDYKTGTYLMDQKLPQADRLRTNHAVRKVLRENSALADQTSFYYYPEKGWGKNKLKAMVSSGPSGVL